MNNYIARIGNRKRYFHDIFSAVFLHMGKKHGARNLGIDAGNKAPRTIFLHDFTGNPFAYGNRSGVPAGIFIHEIRTIRNGCVNSIAHRLSRRMSNTNRRILGNGNKRIR